MAIIYTADNSGRLNVSNTAIPAGNTIANTTTETAFTEPQPTLPPSMWYAGRVFDLEVTGTFGSAVIVPSLRAKIKLNSVTIGDTGIITTVGSLTDKQWSGWLKISVLTVGASGTIEAQGCLFVQALTGIVVLPIINTGSITIDMTVNQTLTLTVQWGAVSASNTITLRQFTLKG